MTGLFSRTLLGTEDDQVYKTHGLWERCYKPKSNSQNSNCSLFDWQNKVKDTVAAGKFLYLCLEMVMLAGICLSPGKK